MAAARYEICRDGTWVTVPRSWRDQFILDVANGEPELTMAEIGQQRVRPPMTSQGVSAVLSRLRARSADPAAVVVVERPRGTRAAPIAYVPYDLPVIDQLRRRAADHRWTYPRLTAASGLIASRVRSYMTVPTSRFWLGKGLRVSFRDIGLLCDGMAATGHRYELIERAGWKPTEPTSPGTLFTALIDRLTEDPLSDDRLAKLLDADAFSVRRMLRGGPAAMDEIFTCDRLAAAMGCGWGVIEIINRQTTTTTIQDLLRRPERT